MSIKEKDIKLLWGRSANRCSFPDCREKLSQDNRMGRESFLIGEQAHIVGKGEGSSRSNSILTADERDSYHNLILLCPNHHTLIDRNPEDYPIEKLHMIKSQHEYWVESALSESHDSKTNANNIIYAHLIDLAVDGCLFSNWEEWISPLLIYPRRIAIDIHNKALVYTLKMHKAVWPGTLPELESSMKLFSTSLNIMLNFYMKKAVSEKGYFIEDNSYKRQWHTHKLFAELSGKSSRWGKYLAELIEEVTKSANWLSEIVRKEINPLFMATDGKFSMVWGPDDTFSWRTVVPEYSEAEKSQLIDSYEQKCSNLMNKATSIVV
ncbi:MAG: HNH endonuclease [Deltaproteobacteria bacterium]|nr:HNH endonuclease [Deltaproteobacteria bacterium]